MKKSEMEYVVGDAIDHLNQYIQDCKLHELRELYYSVFSNSFSNTDYKNTYDDLGKITDEQFKEIR